MIFSTYSKKIIENKCIVCGKDISNIIANSWGKDICFDCYSESEKIKRMIEEAPKECSITGLSKCESYIIGDNVVYLTNPAYDAYTLPEYNPEEQTFYHTHYDMDDDNREEIEYICDLDDLRYREDFEDIKKVYNIIES